MTDVPDFLAIGHVARDIDLATGSGRTGGTAAYSALAASRLGLRAAIVTRAAPGESMSALLPDVEVHNVPSAATTTFTNDYSQGFRRQWVSSVADSISAKDVPSRYLGAAIVHLGPIAQEIDPEVARLFPDAVVCVSPQGWMRRWDDSGEVRSAAWASSKVVLPLTDILVLSEQDIAGGPGPEPPFASEVPIVIVTQGRRGARVTAEGCRFHVSAVPVDVVDPTGAGDVYAAAFAIRYTQARDPLDAATFAAVAASFVVEGQGISNIATMQQVISRREAWGWQGGPRVNSLEI